MSIDISPTEEAKRELDETIARLIRGEQDPEATLRACERMDRRREEIYKRVGTVDFAVDTIRELRDK